MKKVVLKVDLHDDRDKQKAMRAVTGLSGIDSIAMDMKDRKMTVIGDVDPVEVVVKLKKKKWYTEIVTVGPAKEPEKKKEEQPAKNGEQKKEDGKKGEQQDKKKKDEKGKEKEEDQVARLVQAYEDYNPYYTRHYHVVSVEENPNACIIC